METSPKARRGILSQIEHQKVFCPSPHSLHLYSTRTSPGSAETRFDAPHFRHLASIRVWHCVTVRILRSNASFTRRSVSSRIACFDMAFFASLFREIGFIYYPNAVIAALSLGTQCVSEKLPDEATKPHARNSEMRDGACASSCNTISSSIWLPLLF